MHVSFRALSSDSIGSASVIGAPISGLGVYVLTAGCSRFRWAWQASCTSRWTVGTRIPRACRPVGGALRGEPLRRRSPLPHRRPARWVETGSETGSSTPATGELVYLGRADDQVKILGFRIELGEIEAAVSAQDSVTAAAVIVREDSPGAQRTRRVCRRHSGHRVGSGRCRRDGSRVHGSVGVRVDGRDPLTVNGKLDRKALPEPAQTTAGFRAPRLRSRRSSPASSPTSSASLVSA